MKIFMTYNPVQTLHQTKFQFRNYRQKTSAPVKLQNFLTAISQKVIGGSFGKKKTAKPIKLIKLCGQATSSCSKWSMLLMLIFFRKLNPF